MPNNRGRQKKLQAKRKKRELAKRDARSTSARRNSRAALVARAAKYPFGPCYISRDFQREEQPALVSVMLTRRAGNGELYPVIALVDRTCLGIKSGFLAPPRPDADLKDLANQMGGPHGGMLDCKPEIALSVIFHAIDYARSLGFEPDPDFPVELLGPRPEALADTPWARPEKPIYISGPDDDVAGIMARLNERVGEGNYTVTMGLGFDPFEGMELVDAEDFAGESGDEGEIEGEGEVVDDE